MSLDQSPSPVVPPARLRRDMGTDARGAVIVGAAGLGLLLLLLWAEPADPTAAHLLAALALGLVTVLVALRSRGAPPPSLQDAGPAVASPGPEAAFRALVDQLPEPVMMVAGGEPDDYAARRVVFANEAARELLRIPAEGALLLTALRDPEVLEAVDEALFGGATRSTVYEPGGAQQRVWRVTTRPLRLEGRPEPLGLVRMRDETDAVRMERMRADFLANASHELRTPLASLAGFIETLKGHARDDPKARDRFLDIMSAQAERMRRLIADLMSLSRIELNEHVPPSGVADLALAAVDVLDAMGPLARERRVELNLDAPPPGQAVIGGARDEVVQIVQNLVDNAVKYSPQGGAVDISVQTGLSADEAAAARWPGAAKLSLVTPDRDASARYVLVRVRDKGPGLKREHLPRLTERFYRVEGQKSGERSGTGLGLAIVKHIVNRHRGGLIVESVVGEGAAFSVYFPLLRHRDTGAEAMPGPRNKTVIEAS